VDQSSQIFFLEPIRDESQSSLLTILISRSVFKVFEVKVKSCPKSDQIFDFWPSQISGVRAPKNLYISDHAHLMGRHVTVSWRYCLYPKSYKHGYVKI